MVRRVLLASPRGFCAGVERAVETVELALEHYGAPVYVRKQIVHNIHVVHDLEARGAIFVEEETEVPEGATVVYSSHGVAPSRGRCPSEDCINPKPDPTPTELEYVGTFGTGTGESLAPLIVPSSCRLL